MAGADEILEALRPVGAESLSAPHASEPPASVAAPARPANRRTQRDRARLKNRRRSAGPINPYARVHRDAKALRAATTVFAADLTPEEARHQATVLLRLYYEEANQAITRDEAGKRTGGPPPAERKHMAACWAIAFDKWCLLRGLPTQVVGFAGADTDRGAVLELARRLAQLREGPGARTG